MFPVQPADSSLDVSSSRIVEELMSSSGGMGHAPLDFRVLIRLNVRALRWGLARAEGSILS